MILLPPEGPAASQAEAGPAASGDSHSIIAAGFGGVTGTRRAAKHAFREGSAGSKRNVQRKVCWPPAFSAPPIKEENMDVAKVTEISAISKVSFEDAIQRGLARAGKTIRNIRSAWIKEQQVRLEKGAIIEYQVNMLVTFVLED
jgi:dodecin